LNFTEIILTLGQELSVSMMYLALPELYIKQNLFSIEFPIRLSGIKQLQKCIRELIKFRVIFYYLCILLLF